MQWLSDKTAELGHRISRSRLSDLERGDRGGLLGVAELLVLGKALGVPPALLLFPIGVSDSIEVLPGARASAWRSYKWFIGDEQFPGVSIEDLDKLGSGPVDPESGMHRWYSDPEEDWNEGAAPIALYHRHEEQIEAWFDANIRAHRLLGDDAGRASDKAELVSTWRQSAERQLLDIRGRIRDLGLVPPELDDRLEVIIEQLEQPKSQNQGEASE